MAASMDGTILYSRVGIKGSWVFHSQLIKDFFSKPKYAPQILIFFKNTRREGLDYAAVYYSVCVAYPIVCVCSL